MCDVLFISNDRGVADLTSKIIEKYGYHVVCMTKKTEEPAKKPDLILFDCNMTPETGFEVYQDLLQRNPIAKILWISSEEDDEISALEAGADDFMRKPIKMDVLIARLNSLRRR